MTRPSPVLSQLQRFAVGLGSALWLGLASPAALAQGRLDVPAQSKIDEAINVHYLATDFVKAEQLLAGTINACGNQCTAPIIAKAWMYIGLIRGVGNQNLKGAKEAFRNAVNAFPGIALDTDLATPEVQNAFNEIAGQGKSNAASEPAVVELTPPPAAPAQPAAPPPPAAPPEPPPPIQCEPKVQEVQTRRPVPVSCVSKAPGVVRGTLYYKEFGTQTYSRVPMKLSSGAWQAEVPCTATGMGGSLSWYMEANDKQGNRLDGYGDAEGPVDIMLSDATTEAPPHFPGKPAPARCADLSDCPPEMVGTPACPGTEGQVVASAAEGKGWGEACNEHSECQEGMGCLNGTCETAPACSSNDDCDEGRCDASSGTCTYGSMGSDSDSGSSSTAKGPTNMVSLSIARDFTFVSGKALCDSTLNPDASCYFRDDPYVIANPATYTRQDAATNTMVEQKAYWNGGDTNTVGQGLIRILLGYDRMFTPEISVGINAGLAFSPIPDGSLALHLDAHGRYWLSGNGKGLRVFVGLGLGLGRVDNVANTSVTETQYQDSAYRRTLPGASATGAAGVGSSMVPAAGTGFTPTDPADPTTAPCLPAQSLDNTFRREFCEFDVQVATKYGSMFVAAGGGAWFNLGGHGPQLELLAKILFPTTGLSLQPTLSYVYGF